MLIGQGFKCIGQTLNSGLMAGKNVYLWIRKNINDPNPILNVAVTMGNKKSKILYISPLFMDTSDVRVWLIMPA